MRYARQGFPSKAMRGDSGQVLKLLQLACGESLTHNVHVLPLK